MTDYLETSVDKFTFKVATDRLYARDGTWVLDLDGRLRLGLTDFLQQRSGDVAFVELKPLATELKPGDELGTIETIKVNISLVSPIGGKVFAINPAVQTSPELINQDPYGEGWLLELEPIGWKASRTALLDPAEYFQVMRDLAEQEVKKP